MLNPEVNKFLDDLAHPLLMEINILRSIIIEAHKNIVENIKWNGPNYTFKGNDRITMRIHPPKKLQLIFHRGAKKSEKLPGQLIKDSFGLLEWKENDRAVATFNNLDDINVNRKAIQMLVNEWISAADA